MAETKVPKQISNRIGRAFALLFNRTLMYNIDHPITTQSLAEFHRAVTHGLTIFSPIVLIMHQENFFIEEEPLDPRINTAKMQQHFKRAGIASVSFQKGMQETELIQFFTVFVDIAQYVTADAMKEACSKLGVKRIKINHVFYQKMTADDAVVDRKSLAQGAAEPSSPAGGLGAGEALNIMAESVLMEEFQKNLSLSAILQNPSDVSRKMIDAAGGQKDGAAAGTLIVQQLQHLRRQVEDAASGAQRPDLPELAEAVFAMKKNLLEGINAKKAAGETFQFEQQIRAETDEITDRVLVQLVTDEYQQGKISVQRLAQILQRLLPDPQDLQRLLPKIKTALMAEGMPLADFLKLTKALKNEFKSEELVKVLEKSAEGIGISADELIGEVSRNPKGAAELIYLASEIRKTGGDEKILSELLVDYIERVGSKIALDAAEKRGQEGEKHLHTLISNVESALVKGLQSRDIQPDVMHKVAERLNERMTRCLEDLKSQWTLKHKAYSADGEEATSVIDVFNKSAGQEKELNAIMAKLRTSLEKDRAQKTEMPQDDPLEAEQRTLEIEQQNKSGLPKGILNRNNILYILEKEIARSMRYETPFSVLMLSIFKVTPDRALPADAINRGEITYFVLNNLLRIFRSTDILGILDRGKILAILPMTTELESRAAMRRVLKEAHEISYKTEAATFSVKLAGAVTNFDKDRTPSLNDFVKRAESDIFDMVNRLRNIHSIY